jgi:hypothetical protein
MPTDKRNADAAISRESYRFIFEFQWKALTETAQLISKVVGIYFFLLLAVIGAIYNSKIVGTELQVIVIAMIIVSVMFAPMMIFAAWGVIRGIDDLEISLRKICPMQFESIGMDAFFRRGRLTARVGAGCAIAILIVIVVAVALIQFR